MTKTAALHNLGCKVNACETQAMRHILEQAGYRIVDFSQKADVYVVNTCTVTQIADRKSRQMLHRARSMNPDAVIIAAGCYAESARAARRPDDAVDIYLGNNEKSTLLSKIEAFEADRQTIFSEEEIRDCRTFESMPAAASPDRVRAFLKIEDGCSRFCSYCLIPYVRGRVRSLRPQDALSQAKALAQSGCREIVLDGIHLTSYGTDFKNTPEEGTDLISLLRALDEIPGIERIRLGSLEPDYITAETAEDLRGIRKLCPHFHLSLQSGSDSVLRRMRRRYTTQEYAEKCAVLRTHFSHPAITTDLICGFPGETREEFDETYDFAQEMAFYQIHVFPYSPRGGTAAASMPHQIPSEVKRERRDRLLGLTKRQQRSYEDTFLGKEVRVLVEESKETDGVMTSYGHTESYLYVSCEGHPGEIVSGNLIRNTNDRLQILSLH